MSTPDEKKPATGYATKNQLDAEYLKSEGIGQEIAKAMAVLYMEKPKNPVDFLGKYLLNVSKM